MGGEYNEDIGSSRDEMPAWGDQSEAITKVVVHHTPIDASALETGSGGLIVDMVTRTAPTILTAKNFNGVIHSSGLGNVSWNQDGQCAFSHRKGVVILVRLSLEYE